MKPRIVKHTSLWESQSLREVTHGFGKILWTLSSFIIDHVGWNICDGEKMSVWIVIGSHVKMVLGNPVLKSLTWGKKKQQKNKNKTEDL